MKTQRVISLVMLVAAGVISSASAHAAKYGTAGCGLGAVVWEDQPGKIQILAATVNNIVSPQTSAITSGTSNCVEDPKVASAMYIAVNERYGWMRIGHLRCRKEWIANIGCNDQRNLI